MRTEFWVRSGLLNVRLGDDILPKKRKNPKMIEDFHRGAYLYYAKCVAPNRLPRLRLLAKATQVCRTSMHLLLNSLKER